LTLRPAGGFAMCRFSQILLFLITISTIILSASGHCVPFSFSFVMGYFMTGVEWAMRAMLRRLVAGFPPWRPGFEPRSGHVGFVVGKVALGQVFSEYFDFPCQFLFHRLLHIHHHLSSGAGTIGQLVADVPSGLSLTPPRPTYQVDSVSPHPKKQTKEKLVSNGGMMDE
jgi:hypothetical protein